LPKSKLHRHLAVAVLAILALPCAYAQSAVQLANAVNTLAGTGTAALYGDNGPATAADLNQPQGIVSDAARNLYIADTGNSVIRRIDAITGTITTIAGTGTAGFSGDAGAATSAQLNAPVGVALDANGDVYIADTGNNRIRVLYQGGALASQLITLENPSVSTPVIGDIYTIAGSSTTAGYSGDLGKASLATFASPQRVAVDAIGNVYISDSANNRVRMVYLSGTAASALIKSSNTTVTSPSAGYLYTVVGTGTASSTGDGAAAGLATINAPSGIAVDTLGNLFLAESAGNRVRVVFVSGTLLTSLIKLDAAGSPTPTVNAIYTIIGTGTASYSGDGALASTATINQPAGLFVDSAEDIYLADSGNHIVRLLAASTGLLTTIAGNNALGAGFAGDQGLATAASFASPSDVTQDAMGSILIADGISNQRIRVVSNNTLLPTTAVGSTSASQTILLQVNSALQLAGLAAVPSMGGSTEYAVTPSSNCAVGTQLSAGTICTLTVSFTPAYPGQRNVPLAVTDANGNVYSFQLSATGKGAQTAVIPGQMTTIAGTGVPGFAGDNGPALSAKINVPGNIAVDAAGNIFFSDKSNYCMRVIYAGGPVVARLIYLETGFTAVPGSMYTIAGIGGQDGNALAPNNVLATSTKLFIPTNMAIDANDNVYFMEISKAVRKISAQTGLLSTVVGNGSAGYGGDGGLGVNAQLFLANGIALDNLGNLYVVDGNNYRIRKVVLSTGVITTIAGTGINGFSGDFGPATAAQISLAQAIAADQYGNVYIADDGPNARIRVVYGGGSPSINPAAKLIVLMNPFITTPIQGYIYTIAGTGTAGYTGDGGLANIANLDFPYSLSLDAAGNIYFPEEASNHLRRIDVGDGIIRTIGGYAATAFPVGNAAGDGGVATSADLSRPYGATVDALGNVYIADGSNDRLRFISSTAYPLTFASTAVGSTSPGQTVTAVSNGNLPFDFSAFVLNGQSGQFAQVSSGTTLIPQCALGTPLTAGSSCTTALTFSPHSDGTVTGTEVFAGSAPTQTVQLIGTATGGTASTTLLTLPSTAVYGSTVQVSASVTAGGSPVTSGTVVFSNGTQTIATVSLGASGTAATTLPNYPVGNDTITATYSAASTANLLSASSSTISITPATLTVTATNQSLVYLQPVPALTYTITGFVNNDTQSVVTGAPSLSTTATSTSADGVYPINCATGTLSAANYIFTCINGSLTVSGATAQTITFNPIPNQVYGAASFTLNPTSTSGLPVTLTVSGPATLNGSTLTVTGVGTVIVQATQPGNAVYRAATPVPQTFTVTPAPLTIVVANASRNYGSPNPSFTATVTGLVRGDTLGNTVLVTYASSAGVSASVGSYAITATVSGPDGADYAPTITPGTLTVQQAPLTITVANASRAYGAANPSFTATVSGLVNGDSIGVTLLQSFSTNATPTSTVGPYAINVAVTGSSASQYAIQTVPGVLTVTPVALSISADSFTRLYGAANPAFTGSITGGLNGDTFTETFTTTSTTTTNAGRYAIVPSVTGPNLADYTVATSNGTLLIELANSQLTLVSSAPTVNIGATVSFTATASSTTTGTPTGSVSFLDGATLLATVALTNGSAILTTSSLLVGTHTISASYTGDYDFYGSSATAVTSIVAAPGYTLTPATTTLTIASGGSGTVGLQVASVGGYAGSVSFACAGLPAGMSCTFAPATLALTTATASQQTVLTIATSSSQASLRGSEGPGPMRSMVYLAVMPGLLSLCLLRLRFKSAGRWITTSLSALLLLSAIGSLSGCGSNNSPTLTPKGAYSITVQAQATNASSNSVQLAVTIN
jgi:sugar lactone lactonase YvrE